LLPKRLDYFTDQEFQKVYGKIPDIHKPIFKWLHLHFRRTGEACALYKKDFDQINKIFYVHRALSNRVVVDSLKTNWKNPTMEMVDCDPEFEDTAKWLLTQNPDSPYMFVNPRARNKGKRYSLESLRNILYKACDEAEVRRVWTYRATKHTACMDFMENGGTEAELMILTGHKNIQSVKPYMEITMRRKRMAREAAKRRKTEAAEQPLQNLYNVIPFSP